MSVQSRTSEEFPWEQPEIFREDTGYADFVKSIGRAGKWSATVLDDDEIVQGQMSGQPKNIFGPRSVETALERLRSRRSRRQIDITSIPVMGMGDPVLSLQPQKQQAGRGALPGAQNAQHGPRQGGRSAHTDHRPRFGCRICGGIDHTEAVCAKPSARGGDSPYCPYHRSLSGAEQHADSACHQCVDRCWEDAVDDEGIAYERADIDRLVTEYVRSSRSGRPEPRCANTYSHWAMCVSRHIRANGLDGLDASLLPVRRSETQRREERRELSWTTFNHDHVDASRYRLRDTYWECDSADQLMEKLESYAVTGTYQSPLQRRQGHTA